MRSWIAVITILLLPLCARADYQVETVAEGLQFPWSLAFLPGGDMLVTERSGAFN